MVATHLPLMMGLMLRTDDLNLLWIEIIYERLLCICLECGYIGHSLGSCMQIDTQMDITVNAQMEWIRQNFNTSFRQGFILSRQGFIEGT